MISTAVRMTRTNPSTRRHLGGLLRSNNLLPAATAFLLLGTTPFPTQIYALPFGTRGGTDDDKGASANNNKDDNVEIESVFDLTGLPLPSRGTTKSKESRRCPTVESFYSTHSSSTSPHDDDEIKVSNLLTEEIHNRATNLTTFLTSTRRLLHRTPELMYNERTTSAIVRSLLSDMNIDHTTGWAVNTHTDTFPGPGGYGVVADIGTGQSPCIVLRADMDALPIVERTENVEEYKSQNVGTMHACGHDGHTTMLLGAASILKDVEESLNGTVRLMFQPAEEGGAGGKRMREEGILDMEPKAERAFGLHVWPLLPSGTIASRPGPLLAAADRFEILLSGVGGHAAMPHLTIDPIVTTSAIIMNLQSLVSRSLNPLEAGVVSVTKIDAGDAFNIIPASSLMKGTIRALSTNALLELRQRVEHVVSNTADTYGCNVTVDWSPDYYPPTVNDPTLYHSFASDVGGLVSSEGYVRNVEPTMGAEDFSFVAEQIPSTFFLLGQGSGKDPPTNYGLHHPHFALDESVMPRGVELHVNLALRALKKLAEEEGDDDGKASTASSSIS